MAHLGTAISIAADEFADVLDKGGRPYILHCLWVMDRVRHLGEDHMIAAVLHDLVEDTDWNHEMLEISGFSKESRDAIRLLTHDDRTIPYPQYIERLSGNAIAREVKLRDLEHNSKITRLKGVRESDLVRAKKYHTAYLFLKSVKK
jgi:hypothetical protein